MIRNRPEGGFGSRKPPTIARFISTRTRWWLRPGVDRSRVAFAKEQGDKGPQASTVWLLGKHGGGEGIGKGRVAERQPRLAELLTLRAQGLRAGSIPAACAQSGEINP